jgi:PAS domain S-box-containing protein
VSQPSPTGSPAADDADVAALRAENERLRAEIAQFSAFFENSPNDLFVLDVRSDGNFVFERINPMVTKSTGYMPEMMLGKTPQECLTPANSARLAAMYRRCAETRQRVEYEIIGRAPIGEVIRRTILVPILDQGGFVRKVLGTTTDLTAIRRVEAALAQAQKMELVGQLTRGLSHDFNNLLTTIIGNLEILIGGAAATGRDRALAGAALRAAERGAELTSHLLEFARRQPLKPEPVDLNRSVAALAGMLGSALGAMIRVELALTPDLPPALVDARQLDLVLLNLAINARDAMPDGGTVRIETRYARVDPPTRPEHPPAGEYLAVVLSDTGSGIGPDILDRVFEPFFTTKEPGRGSGLGLSQALAFVRQSGGGVRLDSRPGVGTTIAIYLPPAATPAQPAEARAPVAAAKAAAGWRRRPLSVLLVDDEPAVRETTAAMLSALGHRAIEAGSGQAALRVLAGRSDIEAVLIDYAMPEMNGAELAAQIRRTRPAMPILFITGFAAPAVLAGEHAAGRVLQKPFKPADLGAKLAELVGSDAAPATATAPRI